MEIIKDEVILGYTAKLPRQAKEDSFYHIKSSHDQDLNGTVQILDDMTQQSYSLLCPISLTHQEVPVRTSSCRHVATFDLGSCLKALTDFDLMNCYSQLILKSKVDCALTCPICKAKDKLYVDGIIETFIKFNPDVEGFKFTENGDVVDCDGNSKMDHDKTIDLVSPLPYCEMSRTTSPCISFTLLAPLESPPPIICSPLEKSTTAFQCSPEAFTFGPKRRIVTKSPLLVGLGKRDSLPAPSKLDETIDISSPPPFITFSPMELEKSPEPSKFNKRIASSEKNNSSLLHRSEEHFSARVPFPLLQRHSKEKEETRSSAAMTKSGWELPNPFMYCRSPLYRELYDQASAFTFPETKEDLGEEAVFAAARRRFSTVDLESPRPIF